MIQVEVILKQRKALVESKRTLEEAIAQIDSWLDDAEAKDLIDKLERAPLEDFWERAV